MVDDSKAKVDFKKQVEALKKFKGRGTELVSLYITPDYPVHDVMARLRDEYGQASNIKSKSTQKNVQAALERIMHFLKGVNKPPENGIAVFAGNVSQSEGKTDYQIYSVVPPMPLNTQFYRCESKFILEPLEELMDQSGAYGLVVMDGKEATVAVLRGTKTDVIKRLNSTAHQKVHKGGQSAARYDRLHIEAVEYYYKRVGQAMDAFVGLKNFKGVIIGGPGPAKDDFAKMKTYNYQLHVLGVVDTGYTDEYGIREVIEKSSEIIAEQETVLENKLLDEFMREISKNGLAVYGFEEIKQVLETGQASHLLVTEGMDLVRVEYDCPDCKKHLVHFVEPPVGAVNCDCGKAFNIKEEDAVGLLISLAESKNIPITFVSKETAEGAQFYGTFRGIGAFLRYK